MSLNRVILCGRLGQDPKLTYSQQQFPFARFSLATSERRKVGENWIDQVEWHKITVLGKSAEACSKYLRKGSEALIEGRIQYKMWEKNGEKRYSTEIVASNVQFVGGKREASEGQPAPEESQPGQITQPSKVEGSDGFEGYPDHGTQQQQQQQETSVPFNDDDVPF